MMRLQELCALADDFRRAADASRHDRDMTSINSNDIAAYHNGKSMAYADAAEALWAALSDDR